MGIPAHQFLSMQSGKPIPFCTASKIVSPGYRRRGCGYSFAPGGKLRGEGS